jgi:sialate O-acetylesterase
MKKILLATFLSGFLCQGVFAKVSLPALFGNHMMLQQKAPVKIWGKADPGEKISINILKQSVSTKAGKDGKWTVWLKPLAASAPISMTIKGSNSITINDILVGDVWVASGQSNMEWRVNQSNNYEAEAKNANYPQIRLFHVINSIADTALDFVRGKWEVCTPQNVGTYTGVGYFFIRDMYQHYKVPMGLIEADWGATNAEAWTSVKALQDDPKSHYILDRWNKQVQARPQVLEKYKADFYAWKKTADELSAKGDSIPLPPRNGAGPGSKNAPGSIYNAVIAPMVGYTIKGIIWYQGEGNAYVGQAYPYRYMFATLITSWRKAWGQGNFPFIFVQLSSFKREPYWPVMRESQADALRLPNTGMAVSIDLGDSTNAHYKNKQDVGYRLQLAARHLAGETLEYSGPVYQKMSAENGGIRLYFDHANGMKTGDGGPLKGFTIAGEDGVFVPAEAKIDGKTIVVSNSKVSKPVAARYSYVGWPFYNLVNGDNLPASSFRTDTWETDGKMGVN